MKTFSIIAIAIAAFSAIAFSQPAPTLTPTYRPLATPPVYQPKTAPAYAAAESVSSIAQVTDVSPKDEYYTDLRSLIERYSLSGLTKDKRFNGTGNLSFDDLANWTASGQVALMSIASRQGIDQKRYATLLGKGCGAPRIASYTEAQAMKVIQCRFIVPAVKTASPEKLATRGRFAIMLNQALDTWASGLTKALADLDAAKAARAAARISLFDTFDDVRNGWPVADNSALKTSIAGSRYVLQTKFDSILIATIPTDKVPKLDPNRDFSIEVSFAFTSGKPTDSFGLVWGVSNDRKRRHSYGVLQNGNYYVGKHEGGKWVDEIKVSETNLVKKGLNVMNRLIVRKRGNQLDLYIDTIRVTTIPYVAFESNGSFGFQINGESSVSVDYTFVQQD